MFVHSIFIVTFINFRAFPPHYHLGILILGPLPAWQVNSHAESKTQSCAGIYSWAYSKASQGYNLVLFPMEAASTTLSWTKKHQGFLKSLKLGGRQGTDSPLEPPQEQTWCILWFQISGLQHVAWHIKFQIPFIDAQGVREAPVQNNSNTIQWPKSEGSVSNPQLCHLLLRAGVVYSK